MEFNIAEIQNDEFNEMFDCVLTSAKPSQSDGCEIQSCESIENLLGVCLLF